MWKPKSLEFFNVYTANFKNNQVLLHKTTHLFQDTLKL